MPIMARRKRSITAEVENPVAMVTTLQMPKLSTTRIRFENRSPICPATGQANA